MRHLVAVQIEDLRHRIEDRLTETIHTPACSIPKVYLRRPHDPGCPDDWEATLSPSASASVRRYREEGFRYRYVLEGIAAVYHAGGTGWLARRVIEPAVLRAFAALECKVDAWLLARRTNDGGWQ